MDGLHWVPEWHVAPGKRPRPTTPTHDLEWPRPSYPRCDLYDEHRYATEEIEDTHDFDETMLPTKDFSSSAERVETVPKARAAMQTGCIPCLMKGLPCDPKRPGCRKAMSADWEVNYDETNGRGLIDPGREQSTSLTIIRPDTKWRRGWRERHSLSFFVNFSAPQMAGFFDSTFWHRMVIQTSYYEPAILHAISAIGALHESILQRAFADKRRKAAALEFALAQCNKSIGELTSSQALPSGVDLLTGSQNTSNSRLALTTCILFTAFEALQGRCDSAVSHALQGRKLLQATDRSQFSSVNRAGAEDMEHLRPIVERLEVQATALLDKGRRPDVEVAESPPLLDVVHAHSLDHAHSMLHSALNSVMRFMQGFQPTASRDVVAVMMQQKYMLYVPWFMKWEDAFTAYLAANREAMTTTDLKRAMVLKANHLVGTMLASVDQAAGPVAYDAYEAEFLAIVDLSREVLASFSCPPLPTLTGSSPGMPYLSFSLWVTDPLWMTISRCRNPSIRRAAFSLLSQNPRQEGIWHAGPMLFSSKSTRRTEPASHAPERTTWSNGSKTPASSKRSKPSRRPTASSSSSASSRTLSLRQSATPDITSLRALREPGCPKPSRPLQNCDTRVKAEWYAAS